MNPRACAVMLVLATFLLILPDCALDVPDVGDATERVEDVLDVDVAREAITYSTINSNGGASLLANGAGKLGCLRGYIMTLQNPGGSNAFSCSGDTCVSTNPGTGVRAKQCWDFFSPNGTPEFSRQCAFEFFSPFTGQTNSVPHLLLYTPGYNTCAVYPVGGGARAAEVRLNENKLYWPPPAATKNMRQPPMPPPGTMTCPGGLMVGPSICAI